MPQSNQPRREFLKTTGTVAAAATLIGSTARFAHAAEDNTIQVALVGCGGRGTGAAQNCLSVQNGPIKLVAMADVFDSRLKGSWGNLSKQFPDKCDVPEDRRFVSFDGYKSAMDCLKPGDIVILTTPPAFRWVHYTYAIEKGLNVFMEKPVTVDGPSSVRMLDLNEKAKAKNLKVGVGLMVRHCKARGEAVQRVRDGLIGDVLNIRAYRMAGPTGTAHCGPKPGNISELLYQIQNFHGFLWASGGAVSDFLIHNIDEGCWIKGEWPVMAQASGGRHYRGDQVDQNFDHYAIEYTFADGTKMHVEGRTIPGCHNDFATYAHGSKGSMIFSTAGHVPARSRIFKGQKFVNEDLVWQFEGGEPNPYQVEWDDIVDAIRTNKEYNEVERGVKSSVATSMGRMAAHTGQVITYDDMLHCEHEFAPGVDKLTPDGPAPLVAAADGTYPVPLPGIVKNREF
jgi:predicted dehydrogenase